MSQNKTVFPGVGSEDDFRPNYQPASSGVYSRFSGKNVGTVYPGMEGGYTANPAQNGVEDLSRKGNVPTGKPIVGFLYSISRTGVGEYWPLHIGQNLIGRSPECDIVLPEGTVSARHANLHINKMKKPEKTEATISHLGATNGVEVNENSVSVARPMECVNGDIITIGEAYQFLLVLIDSKALGLKVAENFIPVNQQEYLPDDYPGNYAQNNMGNGKPTRHQQDFPPHFYGPTSHYDGGNRPTDGTVGMDPSNGGFRSGGTVGMD